MLPLNSPTHEKLKQFDLTPCVSKKKCLADIQAGNTLLQCVFHDLAIYQSKPVDFVLGFCISFIQLQQDKSFSCDKQGQCSETSTQSHQRQAATHLVFMQGTVHLQHYFVLKKFCQYLEILQRTLITCFAQFLIDIDIDIDIDKNKPLDVVTKQFLKG